jgi:hypothetical protein
MHFSSVQLSYCCNCWTDNIGGMWVHAIRLRALLYLHRVQQRNQSIWRRITAQQVLVNPRIQSGSRFHEQPRTTALTKASYTTQLSTATTTSQINYHAQTRKHNTDHTTNRQQRAPQNTSPCSSGALHETINFVNFVSRAIHIKLGMNIYARMCDAQIDKLRVIQINKKMNTTIHRNEFESRRSCCGP